MPRIRYRLFPGGINVNNPADLGPEGTVRDARNCAPFSTGVARSVPPFLLYQDSTSPTLGVLLGRSLSKFNGRFVVRGIQGGTNRFRREVTAGGTTFANITTATGVTLNTTTNPTLMTTMPPNAERNEQLFALETSNAAGNNGLVKINDSNVMTLWGIKNPTAAEVAGITAVAQAQNQKYINTAAADPIESAADWTMTAADEDGLKAFTAIDTVANPAIDGNAIRFRVGKDDQAQMVRSFGSDIDLTTFGATSSPEEDFIQFWVRVRRPKHLVSVEVAFDTTAAGDFKSTFFTRELTFVKVKKRKKRRLISLGDMVPVGKEADFLQKQQYARPDLSFSETLGNQKILVSKNTWTRVTLPKTSFDKVGSASWATVRAIRFTVQANKQGRTAVFLDSLKLVGGVGMMGDYEYTITYRNSATGTRSNPAIDNDAGAVTNIPNSVVKAKVSDVERQSVLLTFPLLTFDTQVDFLEVWRTMGNGKAYFKAGEMAVAGGTVAAGTTFLDDTADYFGLHSDATTDVLDPTEELPLDNTSPNDANFIFRDMVDRPLYGRFWWAGDVATTDTFTGQAKDGQGNAYYSPIGRYEAVDAFVPVTSGKSDPIQKLIVWNDRLFAFTKSALYEIVGTDEPFVAQKIEGAPGTLQPWTVSASAAGIFYLAEDGIYVFTGGYAKNITDSCLLPVFRYRKSVGSIQPPIAFPDARGVAGKNAYYLTNPGRGFLVFDFDTMTFRTIDGAPTPGSNAGALYYDFTTGKLYGDASTGDADITEFDNTTFTGNTGTNILELETQAYRSGPGRQAILRKVYVDLTCNTTTIGTATPQLTIDDTAIPLTAATLVANARRVTEYNVNRAGDRFSILLQWLSQRDVVVNALEFDIYEPELDE